MNRKIALFRIAGLLVFTLSCSLPITISLNTNGSESADQEPSPPTETKPEPSPTAGPIDCGIDLGCFYQAAGECQESTVVYSQTMDMMGTDIFSSLLFTILGPVENGCEFTVKTSKVLVSYSEEALQQLRDTGMSDEEIESQRQMLEDAQADQGFDEVCRGSPEDLIAMMQDWEAGIFSTDDWNSFTCEGKLFSTLETEEQPADEAEPIITSEPPSAGNLLGNFSFESNPDQTQPRWIVETRNTNVVAKWTDEVSKLGQYSLLLSATESANQGFPGWFMAEPLPVEETTWHVFEVWAMSPDGADAFVAAEYLDENGVKYNTQSSGCVDLEPNIWKRVGFGIAEERIAEISFLRLGLQQCLLETEGMITTIYYDQVYLGTTPPK